MAGGLKTTRHIQLKGSGMPAYFPENNDPRQGDTETRVLQKINSVLFSQVGEPGTTGFPEGCVPLSGDTKNRSLTKINALRNAS